MTVRDKIKSLTELPENWDSYGGGPVKQSMVDLALVVLRWLLTRSWPDPDVSPTSAGGVVLEWGDDLTINIDVNDGFSFLYKDEEGDTEGDIEDFMLLLPWIHRD